MKHLKFLFLFIGLAIFASCSESDVEGGRIGDGNQAAFHGSIGELQTRVTGTSWDEGDAIGVFALKAGQALSELAIHDGKANVKYTTVGGENGVFKPTAAPIIFPETGNLDFVAYYPFKNSITDYAYNIDVTTQSDLAAIDLLYSNNAKGESKANQNVGLQFKHMLSKLVLNVEIGEGIASLEGLTATISDVVVDGEFALADGSIVTGTTKKMVTPNVAFASDNKKATIVAILVPGQNLEDVTFAFSLGGKDYEWKTASHELTSSMKYVYQLRLVLDGSGEPGVESVIIGATISDWGDGYIGDEYIDLTPEEEPGVDGEFVTINELRTMYANSDGGTLTITDPMQLKAVVISDRAGGNSTSLKNGYFQDEVGDGLAFRVTDDQHEFNLGEELIIDITGAELSQYGGAVQLGFGTAKAEVNATDVAVAPIELTIEEVLEGNYDGILVKVQDVQFKEYEGLAFYEGTGSTNSRALENSNGALLDVITTKYAQFKDNLLPKGKGDIVGIASMFFGKWQLNPRNIEDVAGMSNDESTRFTPDTEPVVPGDGDGTKENPYSVAQAIANQGETGVWVKGFIVGSYNGKVIFGTDNASEYNLNIADDKDELADDKVVNVQLPAGEMRDLSLSKDASLHKVQILFKGDLVKYNTLPGIKNTKEYELVTNGGTDPDPIVFTTDKSAVVLNAASELSSIIKLTTDAAQSWTVASDAAWLTTNPANGTGNADITLTATENTAETARTANVTFTPTDNAGLTAIVVAVTQNGKPAAGGEFATDLFFSEYVEGSSNNKYLEIYNGTGATVDLTDYEVVLYSNGATERGNNIQLTGTLADGAVFIISNADGAIYSGADVTSTVTYFNGDDAVALQKISSGDYVDIIGRIGERPNKKWSAGGDLETLDKTLVRKPSVRGGVTVNPTEGFPTLATEWIGYPVDTAEHLGSHTMN